MQKSLRTGLNQLMQKDMDRKDFLKYVGLGFVALTGAAAVVKNLNQLDIAKKQTNLGYGANVYGGAASTRPPTAARGK